MAYGLISFISLRVIHPSIFLSPLFWAIIAIFIYIYYKHNQPGSNFNIFKSHKTIALGGTVLLTTFALLFVNFILPTPSVINKESSGESKYSGDDFSRVEADFYNLDKHVYLLENHFQNDIESKTEEANFTINNFYAERRDSEVKEISDIAYWGYGVCLFYQENYHGAIHQFATVQNTKLPYLNFFIAKTLLTAHPDLVADGLAYLKKEIKYNPDAPEEVYSLYVDILYEQKDYNSIQALLDNQATTSYVIPQIAEEVYFRNGQIVSFFQLMLKKMYGNSDLIGVIAALLIMLVWLIYMIWLDTNVSERIFSMIIVAVSGMFLALCSVGLYDFYEYVLHFTLNDSVFNNLLYCIFGIGFIEELVKIIPILVIFMIKKDYLEPYDYIFYACVSALGFAFAENVMYFGNLHASYTARALTSCVGHMFFSSMIAYGIVLAKFKNNSSNHVILYVIGGLFIASTLHGLYDFLIFTHFRLTFLVGFLMSVLIWIIMINNCLNNSKHFSYQISHRSEQLMVFVSLSLVSIFVFEYVTFGFQFGAEKANELLYGAAIIYGIFIFFFTSNIVHFDLVRGYWRKIRIENEGEKIKIYSPVDLIYYAYRFFDLNTQFPQNFVSKEILIYAHPRNEYLIHEIKEPLRGKIVDRVIIETVAKNNEPYLDPSWFLVSLSQAFNQGDNINNYVLMRFLDKDIESSKIKSYTARLMAIPKKELLQNRRAQKENFIDLGSVLVGFSLND